MSFLSCAALNATKMFLASNLFTVQIREQLSGASKHGLGCRLQVGYVPQESRGTCHAHSWKSNDQAIGPPSRHKPVSVELSCM